MPRMAPRVTCVFASEPSWKPPAVRSHWMAGSCRRPPDDCVCSTRTLVSPCQSVWPASCPLSTARESPLPPGELARWLPDGSLDRLGPVHRAKLRARISPRPRRTEMALCALPGVRHALVRPATTEPGSRFIAYVLPDPATGPLPNDGVLRQFLREQGLPDPAVPAAFVSLKDVPLSAAGGHLDRAALPAPPKRRNGRTRRGGAAVSRTSAAIDRHLGRRARRARDRNPRRFFQARRQFAPGDADAATSGTRVRQSHPAPPRSSATRPSSIWPARSLAR